MTTTEKKITLATVKSFIRKNEKNLLIMFQSDYDGMAESTRFNDKPEFQPAKKSDRPDCLRNDLGIAGAWFVNGSRDSFRAYETATHSGIYVYNSCGSFTLAIAKDAPAVEAPASHEQGADPFPELSYDPILLVLDNTRETYETARAVAAKATPESAAASMESFASFTAPGLLAREPDQKKLLLNSLASLAAFPAAVRVQYWGAVANHYLED